MPYIPLQYLKANRRGSLLNRNHCRSVLNSLVCSLLNWRCAVLFTCLFVCLFFQQFYKVRVSLRKENNALYKLHKVSKLASPAVI